MTDLLVSVPGMVVNEDYSDDLAHAARVCHQLHVNLGHMKWDVECITDMAPDALCSGLIADQIKKLEDLLAFSGERFVSLLQRESKLELTFQDEYPFIKSYPEWIDGLFPYIRKKEVDEQIIAAGGHMVFNSLEGMSKFPNVCVPQEVTDNFIVVWYPIAAQFDQPGYIWKTSEKKWQTYSLEL